jgi:hypothetical protein
VKIADVRIIYATPDQEAAAPHEPMRIEATLEATEPVEDVVVGIAVYSSMGWLVFGTNTDIHAVNLGKVSGRRNVTFDCAEVPLLDGTYAVTVGLHTRGGIVYDSWEQQRRFEVAATAPAALALEHVAVALDQRRLPVGPGLAQDHREALEVRGLHQGQRSGQR